MNAFKDFSKKQSGRRIEYQGKTITVDGEILLQKGDCYDDLICKLGETISALSDEEYEVACLNSNCKPSDSTKVQGPEAIKSIITKLCNLQSEDVCYDGEFYALGTGISESATPLLGKEFNWELATSGTKSILTYSSTDGIGGLPSGYSVGSVDLKVKGSGSNGVMELIRDSRLADGTVDIPIDRFPAIVNMDTRVIGPEGQYSLRAVAYLASPGSYGDCPIFEVHDYTAGKKKKKTTLTEIFDKILSTLAGVQNYINSLKNFGVSGTDFCNGLGIKALLGQCIAQAQRNQESITGLNTVNIDGVAGCDLSQEYTLQEAFTAMANNLNELNQSQQQQNEDIDNVEGLAGEIASQSNNEDNSV